MKNIKLFFVITGIIVCFMFSSQVKASHMMGGEITWTCVGHDSFMMKMVLYRDCNGIPLSAATITFKCKSTSSTVATLSIPVPSGIDITPVCKSSCSRCSNPNCSFPYGVQQFTYTSLVDLSGAGSCCEITIGSLNSTRTSSITTGAASTSLYTEAMLNRCVTPCDNSPVFSNPPIAIICVGQDYNFNNGASDPDIGTGSGLTDSLHYDWTPPLQGPGSPCPWNNPYSYDSPIYFWGYPNTTLPFPRGFHLDNSSGDICFRPMKVEQTVMNLKVSEYRNGVKIGEVQREMQVIVLNCPNNHAPSLSPAVYYKSICEGDSVNFTIYTNDLDPNDSLTISWDHGINGATWTDANGQSKHPTGKFSWKTQRDQGSTVPYRFTVKVKDNACPISSSYTHAYEVLVKFIPRPTIIVSDSCNGLINLSATCPGSPSIGFLWKRDTFPDKFSLPGQYVHHLFSNPGIYPYTLTLTSLGCSKTYYDTAKIDTYIRLVPFTNMEVCKNTLVSLTAQYANNHGPVKFRWNSSAADTFQTKSFTVTKDTLLIVTAWDNHCKAKDTILINMHNFPVVNAGPDQQVCSAGSVTVKATYSFDQGILKSIIWKDYPAGNLISGSATAILSDSGLYICEVTDTLGCSNTDTIKVSMSPPVKASAAGTTICAGKKTDLDAVATGSKTNNVMYKWYAGSALVGTTKKITVQPANTTDYLLKVSETINGQTCKDSVYVKVKVNPLPLIKIDSLPQRCEDGAVIPMDNYVTVDGIFKLGGKWTSPSSGLGFGDIFDPLVSGPGKFQVKYEYTYPMTGCYQADSDFVIINPLPAIKIAMIPIQCTNGPVLTLDNYVKVDGSYVTGGIWSCKSPGLITANQFDPKIAGIGAFKVIYQYTNPLTSCFNSDSTYIIEAPSPVVRFGAATTIGNVPLTVQFYDSSTVSSGTVTDYSWYFGDGHTSVAQNPLYTYLNSGVFNVKLVITSDKGCKDSLVKNNYINALTSSIYEQIFSSLIEIIPNPAKDLVTIKLKDPMLTIKSISVINSDGQAVKTFNDLNVKEFSFKRQEIKKGIYFLKIKLSDDKIINSNILFE